MMMEDMSPEERIDQYLLGNASAEEVEILNSLLANDADLRKRYRFQVVMEGGYREAAIHEDELEPVDGDDVANVGLLQSTRKKILIGITVIAASLAAVIFAALQWRGLADTPIAPEEPVARLVKALDAGWRNMGPTSDALFVSDKFQLEAGAIELEFNRGARVILEGPSSFEIKSADLLHVFSGNLVAKVPEEAIGFTITTNEAEIVDLGTEFGLRVEENHQTEVHVIEGLVEVFERNRIEDVWGRNGTDGGRRVEEGKAIRLMANAADQMGAESIPVRSANKLLNNWTTNNLGLTLLQGNIRLKESVSGNELKRNATAWIEVIPEKQGVLLEQELPVTLLSAGNHRFFGNTGLTLPGGLKVDSYLFHFRSTSKLPVRGAIRFDRRIVGVVCEASQLNGSDSILGLSGVEYPAPSNRYRGLDPHLFVGGRRSMEGGGRTPDEVTLSQDQKTLGLLVNVVPTGPMSQGVDQLRVLVTSKD